MRIQEKIASLDQRHRTDALEYIWLVWYFVLDIFGVWHDSRPLAIISGAVVVITFFVLKFWNLMSIFISIFIAIFALIACYEYPTPPQETTIHGWLLPASEPTPPTSCLPKGTDQGNWLLVMFGPGGVLSNSNMTFTVLKIGDYDAITMTRGPQGVEISVEIKDAKGILQARINNNEFHVTESQTSYSIRPNKSTMGVHDKYGKEVFWIQYLNPQTIRLRGVFYKTGIDDPITISDDRIYLSGGMRLYIFGAGPMTVVPCMGIGPDNFTGTAFTIN